VHVSQLADKFVRDPAEVVRVGDRVTTRVMSVDLERGRIALSMRSDAGAARAAKAEGGQAPNANRVPRGGPAKPKGPAPFTPKPGSVAPNGIRFK